MLKNKFAISVLGAGSYGTSLAILLSQNLENVLLWAHQEEHAQNLTQDQENKIFLPNIKLPNNLSITSSLETAIRSSQIILVVVPSFAFADVLQKAQNFFSSNTRIVWATKGLDPKKGQLLGEVAKEILPKETKLALISGPTFAKELAKKLPTAIALSANDENFAKELLTIFKNKNFFRVYINDDFVGLQIGGAVKNVIAIGSGMADGLGFGANARTALITRGLAEMTRLGVALGAKKETFMGMAGLGDLVLTCTDNQSRNRRFGIAVGQGKTIKKAQQEINQVIEGFDNTKEVYELAKRNNVEMPIVAQIYEVLYKNKNPKEAAQSLLVRENKKE